MTCRACIRVMRTFLVEVRLPLGVANIGGASYEAGSAAGTGMSVLMRASGRKIFDAMTGIHRVPSSWRGALM